MWLGAAAISVPRSTLLSKKWESDRPRTKPKQNLGRAPGLAATSSLHHQAHPLSRTMGCTAQEPRGRAHLSVGADNDLPQVVVHGCHGLADSVQCRIHLLLHMVAIGQQLDHLHHHLEPDEGRAKGEPKPSPPTCFSGSGSKGCDSPQIPYNHISIHKRDFVSCCEGPHTHISMRTLQMSYACMCDVCECV